MQHDLSGRTALVTGGGRGIGRATALGLARRGARVIVTARSRHEIEAVAQEARGLGADAAAIPADMGRDEVVRRLFEQAGPVDILINNAGIIQPIAPAASIDPEAWIENLAVNLNGVFFACRHALPGMLERGWGRIVNVSSGAATGTVTGWSAYSAAKAGVEALTSVVAREVGKRGVRVNAIRPGKVDTEMQVEIRNSSPEDFGHENLAAYRGYKERGELWDPEDPARLILWLLSPEAADLNGQVLALSDPEIAAKLGLRPLTR